MLEKYFQSFASSLNDSSTNCATNPAAGFLGGVQPPNGCQNLFATSPGAQKQQDPRQNQQLVQQMQNCLLQIAAASANPGSLFQFASSPQNNFYLNTYNFLLQNVSFLIVFFRFGKFHGKMRVWQSCFSSTFKFKKIL